MFNILFKKDSVKISKPFVHVQKYFWFNFKDIKKNIHLVIQSL